MASRDELNSLRAQVRAAHRNATAKASRLRSKGLEVSGSSLDPRKPLASVKRYNKAQLESQLGRLKAFNSRGFTPLAGREGSLLPSTEVQKYRQVESRYNAKVRREYSKVKNLPAYGRGMTVSEADKKDRPSGRARAVGDAVARPFEPTRRDLSRVEDARALVSLRKQMERKLSRGYKKEVLDRQRAEFMRMVTDIGVIADVKAARELTDDQFNVLFNYNASVVEDISMSYERVKLQFEGKSEEFQERIDESARERIANAIKWAGTL